MAYIGKAPVNGFHSKQQLTGDGSTVTFTLDYTVADETSMIVSVGGVLQEPKTAFDLAAGGTKITFTEAPASTDRVYIQFLGQAIVQNLLDVNGAEFVLDANGNTSFTADTDDEIDIKVGGTDRSTIKATGFHNVDSVKFVAGTGDDMQMYHDGTNSYLTNSEGALKLATETSGIAITIGHSTSEVTIADNATVTGNLTVGGTTSFGDFDITNVGSIALDTITNDGTDITLDSSGDIILDAAGDTIFLKDAGTTFGSLDNNSANLIIKSGTTTAATFTGANVVLAGTVGSGAITSTGAVQGTTITATTNFVPDASDGAGLGTASLEFSDLFLADAAVINFGDDQDVTLTHVADTGLLLNSTMAIQFNDASQYINAPSNAILDINATDEIELNATLVDINANVEISGTATTTGVHTFTATPVFSSDITLSDDLNLTSDGAVITFGANSEVTLTHVHDDGLLLNTDMQLQFRDSAINIRSDADGDLDINADDEIELNSTLIDINGNVEISGTLAQVGVATFTARDVHSGGITIANDGTIGSVGDADSIAISSAGVVTMTQIPVLSAGLNVSGGTIAGTVATATQNSITTMTGLTTTGALGAGSIAAGFGAIDNGTSNIRSATITAETAFVPDASGGADLGTTALEFNDLFLNDGGKIQLGDDQDVTITHVADTGILINSTNVIQFNDASQNIGAPSNAILDINATDEIELNATLVDVNANVEISGTASVGGVLTTSAAISGSTAEFSGAVTIQGAFIVNEDSADIDTRIESNGETHMLFVDGGNDKVCIGTDTATATLTVDGSAVAKTDTDTSNSGSITLDFTANHNFVLTLTGNVTLANPSTENVGQSGFITCIQDGTGSRTLSLGTDYETAGAAGITLTSTAAATDIVPYVVVAANRILLGAPQLAFS